MPETRPVFYRLTLGNILIQTEGFRMVDQADKNLPSTGKLPADFLQKRQIGRCSESRIKLQRQLQAQRD